MAVKNYMLTATTTRRSAHDPRCLVIRQLSRYLPEDTCQKKMRLTVQLRAKQNEELTSEITSAENRIGYFSTVA